MNRDIILADVVSRQLHKLCLEAPPVHPKDRPPNLRWIFFDAGRYPKYAKAYQDGLSGKPCPDELSLARAAWLAGREAAQ